METLQGCLDLLAKGEVDKALSICVVSRLTNASAAEAKTWIDTFGDPLLHSRAGGLLAQACGLDAQVVYAVCKQDSIQDNELAILMARVTIELFMDAANNEDRVNP